MVPFTSDNMCQLIYDKQVFLNCKLVFIPTDNMCQFNYDQIVNLYLSQLATFVCQFINDQHLSEIVNWYLDQMTTGASLFMINLCFVNWYPTI